MTDTGPNRPVVENAQDARQGARRGIASKVLLWSLILGVVALAIIYFVFIAHT